jgi:hypothetical protein
MSSALRARRHLPPRNLPGTRFCQRLSRPQGHIGLEGLGKLKKFNDLIRNRIRNLPACTRPITYLLKFYVLFQKWKIEVQFPEWEGSFLFATISRLDLGPT